MKGPPLYRHCSAVRRGGWPRKSGWTIVEVYSASTFFHPESLAFFIGALAAQAGRHQWAERASWANSSAVGPLCVLGLGSQLGPRAPPGGESALSTLRTHGVLCAPSNAFADFAPGSDGRRSRRSLLLSDTPRDTQRVVHKVTSDEVTDGADDL